MENNPNDFHVSFFRPVTDKARKNRNMVLWFVCIWATAVFGFQFLLRAVEKPVPEPAYESFVSVWDDIQAGNPDQAQLKTFSNSVLSLLGKVYIKAEYKEALANAFTWSVAQISGEREGQLGELLDDFRLKSETSAGILDPEYILSREALEMEVAGILDVGDHDPRRLVIPFIMVAGDPVQFSDHDRALTEKAMAAYLIHNRSFLTDARFLGFPFHYFYTAVFLLILFIGLCWAYCYITDRREANARIAGVDY